MVMLIGILLLLWATRLLLAGFWTGAGAVLGVTAGCRAMADISWGGAEDVGVGVSLAQQQSLQRQMPTAKVQMAAPIMAAGEVKAQCGSGRRCSSSRRMVASNSLLYLVLIPCTAWWMASLFPLWNKSVISLAQSMALILTSMVSASSAEITWSMVHT